MTSDDFKEYERKIKEFSRIMHEIYERTSILKEFSTVTGYDKQEADFIQIARRVRIPKEFFHEKDAVDNGVIASDFVRAIVNGEENFVLNQILESKKIVTKKLDGFDYDEITDAISKLKSPTDMFIPLEPFFMNFHDLTKRDGTRIIYGSRREPSLRIGNNIVQVHWITSDSSIKDIIVVNKKELRIIQKLFEQATLPKPVEPIQGFNYFSKNKELMLHFGEEDAEHFDFVFRTIVSKPILNSVSAIIISVKSEL